VFFSAVSSFVAHVPCFHANGCDGTPSCSEGDDLCIFCRLSQEDATCGNCVLYGEYHDGKFCPCPNCLNFSDELVDLTETERFSSYKKAWKKAMEEHLVE
jgi:hypothetical protein